MPAERLLHYREAGAQLPGHPERNFTPGVEFSSGRLGSPVAVRQRRGAARTRTRRCCCSAPTARRWRATTPRPRASRSRAGSTSSSFIDDNDVTISGHPSQYLQGFDVARTLAGHGLPVDVGDGEDLDALYARMCRALAHEGPGRADQQAQDGARRAGHRGQPQGPRRGQGVGRGRVPARRAATTTAVDVPQGAQKRASARPRSAASAAASGARTARRSARRCARCSRRSRPSSASRSVRVFDNDLEGSCGLAHIKKAFPGGLRARAA